MQGNPRSSDDKNEEVMKNNPNPESLEGDDGPSGLLDHIQQLALNFKRDRDVPP